MLGWVFLITFLAVFSYLADVEVLPVLKTPVPGLGGSTITVVLLVACIGMLVRIARLSRRGEKEQLRERVAELEDTPEEQDEQEPAGEEED